MRDIGYYVCMQYVFRNHQQFIVFKYTVLQVLVFFYVRITTSYDTGPYSLNGVPLRRVNQKYVIATSTKVDLTAAVTTIASKIDDAFFAREKSAKPAEEVDDF